MSTATSFTSPIKTCTVHVLHGKGRNESKIKRGRVFTLRSEMQPQSSVMAIGGGGSRRGRRWWHLLLCFFFLPFSLFFFSFFYFSFSLPLSVFFLSPLSPLFSLFCLFSSFFFLSPLFPLHCLCIYRHRRAVKWPASVRSGDKAGRLGRPLCSRPNRPRGMSPPFFHHVASKWGCCVGISLRFRRERERRKAWEKVFVFPYLASFFF